MRKNKLRWLLVALVLWAMAEVCYQAYVRRAHRLSGRFYWPSYACERNRPALDRLYALTAPGRTKRAFLEVRAGRLADSVGHLPGAARALLRELAHDVAPSGYVYFSVDPVRSRDRAVAVTAGACPAPAECRCIEWLHPAAAGGVLLQLSCSGPERRHTPTELEYVRVGNASLHATLRQSACYVGTGHGDFLNAQGQPADGLVPYNENATDLLVTKPLRAMGLL